MPKGPRGERRPADVVSAAVMVGKIATGEVSDPKRDAGVEGNRRGGLKGGRARAAALGPSQRKAIAKKAAAARWKKSPSDA